MRGSIRSRSKGSWTIVIDLGRTPEGKRRQKNFTVRGTKKSAEQRLADLLRDLGRGEYVESSQLTLRQWLVEWLAASRVQFRASTYVRYKGIIENDLLDAPFAGLRLQQIRATHIEQYYASATVSMSTLTLHHTILNQALRKAARAKLIIASPMADLDRRPRRSHDKGSADARRHAWTATEARAFLGAAKVAGPQSAAFYALALDSGARKGELCGLTWTHLDLEAGKMRIVQQLLQPGTHPVFGPTKTGRPRTVSLAAETLELLRTHRKHQREMMMANRSRYHDLDLVFAKEWSDLKRGDMLGYPLQMNNLGQRSYATLIKAAGVRIIKFHGLRHTCATLLLQAGEPVHVVSERLGHSKVSMTMEVYAHVLPDMQSQAAATIGALLHG